MSAGAIVLYIGWIGVVVVGGLVVWLHMLVDAKLTKLECHQHPPRAPLRVYYEHDHGLPSHQHHHTHAPNGEIVEQTELSWSFPPRVSPEEDARLRQQAREGLTSGGAGPAGAPLDRVRQRQGGL